MENIDKHRKIAAVLHLLNGAAYITVGYIIFVISGAFTSCTEDAMSIDPSACYLSSLVLVGIPTIIAAFPLAALYKFGTLSQNFLKAYSMFIAVIFIPIGTLIGIHTIKLVKSAKQITSRSTTDMPNRCAR
jgi:hypothetical protein